MPPQYSHLCSRTFSWDVRLGCCRAYLLLHLSEQKMRRRPCPLRAGMALPQFGHRPITLMLPISAFSTISHLGDCQCEAVLSSTGVFLRPFSSFRAEKSRKTKIRRKMAQIRWRSEGAVSGAIRGIRNSLKPRSRKAFWPLSLISRKLLNRLLSPGLQFRGNLRDRGRRSPWTSP